MHTGMYTHNFMTHPYTSAMAVSSLSTPFHGSEWLPGGGILSLAKWADQEGVPYQGLWESQTGAPIFMSESSFGVKTFFGPRHGGQGVELSSSHRPCPQPSSLFDHRQRGGHRLPAWLCIRTLAGGGLTGRIFEVDVDLCRKVRNSPRKMTPPRHFFPAGAAH